MEFRLEKKPLFFPEAGWKSFARSSISNLLKTPGFFDVEQVVDVIFFAEDGKEEFNYIHSDGIGSISLGEPKDERLQKIWTMAKNKNDFLQVVFLHEVGHACFKKVFGHQTNDAHVLRTIQPSVGRGFLDNLKFEKGLEKEMESWLESQGSRFKEQFSDIVAVLASASLGVPKGSVRFLYVSRASEERHGLYDTSKAIVLAETYLRKEGVPLSLSKCLIVAERLALAAIKEDFQECHLLEKGKDFQNEGAHMPSSSAKNILSRLSERRGGEVPITLNRVKP